MLLKNNKKKGEKKEKKKKRSVGEHVEKLEGLCMAGRDVTWHGCCGKQLGTLAKSRNAIEFPRDSAIPLLSRNPKEWEADTRTDICTPMLTTDLHTIAKRWKQSRCPSSNEWIHKAWYMRVMEGYLALTRQESLTRYHVDKVGRLDAT